MHQWRIHVMKEVELARAMQDPSSFFLCLPGVSLSRILPREVVLRSPLRLSINALNRGDFSSLQSLACSQTWVSSTMRGHRVHIRGTLHALFKGTGAKGGATWELIQELGYSGSSLSSWLSLSLTNLLYRENFSQSTCGGHGLSFYMGTGFGLVLRMSSVLKTQQDVSWWEAASTLLTHARRLSSLCTNSPWLLLTRITP